MLQKSVVSLSSHLLLLWVISPTPLCLPSCAYILISSYNKDHSHTGLGSTSGDTNLMTCVKKQELAWCTEATSEFSLPHRTGGWFWLGSATAPKRTTLPQTLCPIRPCTSQRIMEEPAHNVSLLILLPSWPAAYGTSYEKHEKNRALNEQWYLCPELLTLWDVGHTMGTFQNTVTLVFVFLSQVSNLTYF